MAAVNSVKIEKLAAFCRYHCSKSTNAAKKRVPLKQLLTIILSYYYTEGTIGYGGVLQMQFIATTIILGALKGDYRCTTGLLPYWSSGGFSRWTSVRIHYWGTTRGLLGYLLGNY